MSWIYQPEIVKLTVSQCAYKHMEWICNEEDSKLTVLVNQPCVRFQTHNWSLPAPSTKVSQSKNKNNKEIYLNFTKRYKY